MTEFSRILRQVFTFIVVPAALFAVAPGFAGADDDRRVVIRGDSAVIDDEPGVYWVAPFGDGSAYLGVQLEEETRHEEGGARITEVVDESPASEAGLQEGDIVVGFEGATIRGPLALTQRIREREAGDQVTLRILRDGSEQEVQVELGERADLWRSFSVLADELPRLGGVLTPEFNDNLAEQLRFSGELLRDYDWSGIGKSFGSLGCDEEDEDCEPLTFIDLQSLGRPKLGVQLVETTPELRLHLGGTEEAGVLVSQVIEDSPAQEAGIQVGDLIVEVDGQTVKNTRGLRKALADKSDGTIEVQVVRQGRQVTLEVTIREPKRDVPTGPRA